MYSTPSVIAPRREHQAQRKCKRCATDQVCARFGTHAASGQSGLATCASVASRKADITSSAQGKKSGLVRPLWSLEVVPGLPQSQGQAKRRSGGGDYSGRQAAGGKGMNHRSRKNGFTVRAGGCASQAGNHGNAREERCGDGENDGLAHVR